LALLAALLLIVQIPQQVFATTGTGGAWVSKGPSPVRLCNAVGLICSGRVTAIGLDPAHNGTVYLGAAAGGIWKSTDGGSNWVPVSDNQPSLAIGSLAVDPSGTVYAGTGEGDFLGYYGQGVLRSTDGGNSWVRLGAPTFARSSFSGIIVNPLSPNILFASTNLGKAISTTGSFGVAAGVPLGVYVSMDRGSTWNRTLTSNGVGAVDIALDPVVPSTAYATMDGGIYKTVNNGTTWTGPLGNGLPPASQVSPLQDYVVVSASSHLTVYGDLFNLTSGFSNIFKSTDGGISWSEVSTPTGNCASTWTFAVDPTNSNTLYEGANDLCRSTDGGVTWTDIGGYSGYIHNDQHAIGISPFSHSAIYVGNDGGIWFAKNGDTCSAASCWTNLNAGLTTNLFYSLAANPTNSTDFFGGTQDTGTVRHSNSSTIWPEMFDSDGGVTAYDVNNPATMYGAIFGPHPLRSDDSGHTWNSITNGINVGDPGNFIVPITMDLSTPTTLYLGTYRFYKTVNRGDNWTLPSPGLTLPNGDLISAIGVARSNGQDVYFGTNQGRLYASTNGGLNFTEKDAGLPSRYPDSRFLTKIAIDPLNALKVFVTYSIGAAAGKHVFSTTNGGNTWTDITSNLPDVAANSIALDSVGTIYVGTDIGAYMSTNSGSSWSTLGTGLPHADVVDLLFAADGTLLAATYGRGVWALPFDFSISNSGGITVTRGGSGSNSITVTMLALRNMVSLSCSGLPAKSSCTFNPTSNHPSFTSTLTITTKNGTPTGSFTITVTGSGAGVSHTTQFVLTVNH
jgi:photosystem II stability/assembly factor-like uncharacterized protein